MPLKVSQEHDKLHPPTTDDPSWIDTVWLGFAVPEKQLSGVVYMVLRPNRNVSLLGVYLCDDRIFPQGDMLYMQVMPHQSLPTDMRHVELDCFSFHCLEPLKTYELRYDDGVELKLELRYHGLFEPVSQEEAGTQSYSQPCHVQGTICLNHETLAVDCYELKAGAWGLRSDKRLGPMPDDVPEIFGGGDSYAFSSSVGFFVSGRGTEKATSIHPGHGYFYRDGQVQAIKSGERKVVRRAERGFVEEISIEGADAAGRTFTATGRGVNRGRLALGSWAMWMCGTHWNIDGQSAWGMEHEVLLGRGRHFRS